MTRALILASGGLDSSVLAFYVKKKLKKDVSLMFFDYGQKSLEEELFCVKNLARKLKAKLKIIDLKWLGKINTQGKFKKKGEIIKWYVPFRNSIFISAALSQVESEFIRRGKKQDIYLGVKYEGELRFKDTTPEFLKEMNKLASFSERGNFKIKAPFLNKDKEDIIEIGGKLGIDFEGTYSCYIGKGFAKINDKKIPVHCGKCGGCLGRKKGFNFSYVRDTSFYEN